jgi:hypothetical protein
LGIQISLKGQKIDIEAKNTYSKATKGKLHQIELTIVHHCKERDLIEGKIKKEQRLLNLKPHTAL